MLKKTIFSLFLLVFLNCSKTDKYSAVNASLMEVKSESSSQDKTPPPPIEVAKNEVPGEVISPKKTDTISKKIIKKFDHKQHFILGFLSFLADKTIVD